MIAGRHPFSIRISLGVVVLSLLVFAVRAYSNDPYSDHPTLDERTRTRPPLHPPPPEGLELKPFTKPRPTPELVARQDELARIARQQGLNYIPGSYIVAYREGVFPYGARLPDGEYHRFDATGTTLAERTSLLIAALGGDIMYTWSFGTGAFGALLTDDQLATLSAHPDILRITPNGFLETGLDTGVAGTAVPRILSHPSSHSVAVGQPTTFVAEIANAGLASFQWLKNGRRIPGANDAVLTIDAVQPGDAGIYEIIVENEAGWVKSTGAILGVATFDPFTGGGFSPAEYRDIRHPNGNLYDQVLMTGPAVTVTAGEGKITRVSFIDLNDDIVQVEFSGSGSLTITLEDPSGPVLPRNYNQEVSYMKGHASLIVTGAAGDTYISAFSVGRANTVKQDVFITGASYDGWADLARLVIHADQSEFGGIFMGNASFYDVAGPTGIFAPGLHVTGMVRIHDVTALIEAKPVLLIGEIAGGTGGIQVTGGSLGQPNSRTVEVGGVGNFLMTAGVDSHGRLRAAQPLRAQLVREGQDMTQLMQASLEFIRALEMPNYQHFSSVFPSVAIYSRAELELFLERVNARISDSPTNVSRQNFPGFSEALRSAPVDFSGEALVILSLGLGNLNDRHIWEAPELSNGTVTLRVETIAAEIRLPTYSPHFRAYAVNLAEVDRLRVLIDGRLAADVPLDGTGGGDDESDWPPLPRPPPAPGSVEGTVHLSVAVATPEWRSVKIERIYRVADEIWVIARLGPWGLEAFYPPETWGEPPYRTAAVLTVVLPNLPIVRYVIGKTWDEDPPQRNPAPIYLKSDGELPPQLAEGVLLYDFRREP